MNFLTARFDDMEAKWIYKPKDIAIIYVTSWFAIDFVRKHKRGLSTCC